MPAVLSVLALLLNVQTVKADKMDLMYIKLKVDNAEPVNIAAYEANYVNNVFLSLQDMAAALSGTVAQFDFYNDDEGAFHIDTGIPYDPEHVPVLEDESGEPIEFSREKSMYLERGASWTLKNDADVTYYTYADYNIEDLYMSLLDVQLMLDLNFEYENGIYSVDTKQHFRADLEALDAQGYFDYLHGVVLGDATTGEIIFSSNADQVTSIASTTKLMTYLVVMRLIEMGKISMDDMVTISHDASRLSLSDDAVIYLYEGSQTTVEELINAMLIQSSNESALALAEYAGGSQENFVQMMNDMAFRLGMESAVFYNPHGLPEYYEGKVTTMVENRMSANDMFRLATAVVRKYPQIEEITTQKSVWLDYLWVNVSSTNSLLNNMPDLIGLKTGTTDAAGKCLVSARRVNIDGSEHILAAVVFGAEFNADRVEMSELLLKSQGY